jgi:tRNA 2-thiouridine synthesizing protein A
MVADETLDLSGLKCPLPALLAKRAVTRSVRGAILEVVADDPLAHIDIPHMCRHEGFEIVETRRDGTTTHLWLRR